MRVRATLLGVVAIMLAAGAATATTPQTNRAMAKVDAARQLSELSLPSGATEVTTDPSAGSVLGEGPSVPPESHNYLIDDYRFWTVPGKPSEVAAWIEAHPPAHAPGSYGGSPSSSELYSFGWDFTYTSKVTLRALDVEVTKAKGGGSAVRADGVAVWVPMRPSWDYIPHSSRSMAVWSATARKHIGPTIIHDGQDVRRVVGYLDHTAVVPPIGPFHCPGYLGTTFKLVFKEQRPGPAIARATVEEGGCAFISISVRGRDGPGLVGGYRLGLILNKMLKHARTS